MGQCVINTRRFCPMREAFCDLTTNTSNNSILDHET